MIDLGPEGGQAAGKVVAKGTPEEVAVAVAAALNVVEPMMSGMGGYGATLIYDAANIFFVG